MKITKKEFIQAMTNNETVFCGVTKRLYTNNEVYCAMRNVFNNNNICLEKRSCVEHSKYLSFTGDSRLYFNQIGTYTFYKYEYAEAIMYICHHEYYDEVYEKMNEKTMYYYLVRN